MTIKMCHQEWLIREGLDVFDFEPLPLNHTFRQLDNTVLIRHLDYVVEESYKNCFQKTVENIEAWLNGEPIREIFD